MPTPMPYLPSGNPDVASFPASSKAKLQGIVEAAGCESDVSASAVEHLIHDVSQAKEGHLFDLKASEAKNIENLCELLDRARQSYSAFGPNEFKIAQMATRLLFPPGFVSGSDIRSTMLELDALSSRLSAILREYRRPAGRPTDLNAVFAVRLAFTTWCHFTNFEPTLTEDPVTRELRHPFFEAIQLIAKELAVQGLDPRAFTSAKLLLVVRNLKTATIEH